MRIRYDPQADVLVFNLRDEPPTDAVQEPGGIIISYGADGEPVSIEFLAVSKKHYLKQGEVSITLQAAGLAV